MSQTLTIPFYGFELHLQGGEVISMPLSDSNALFLKKPVADLGKKYAAQFQKKVLNQGKYGQILEELRQGPYEKNTLKTHFPAAKDGFSYPDFILSFDYYLQMQEDRVWGIIPVLGLESMASDIEELEERLQEVVKVDFTSRKRLSAVQYIVSALWFDLTSLHESQVSYTFYSPSELVEMQKEKKKKLLPKVATRLDVRRRMAYGREEELRFMERIVKSSFAKNILLIGASGAGKSTLVWELAYRLYKQKFGYGIWETTASVLIKELTLDTGWQDNMSHLVSELTASGDFLFIRNLAELFEVGRYEGNDVSIGDYIMPYLSRGELNIITECTSEERARIEVRNPHFLSFFQVVQVNEPTEGLEDMIRQKVKDIAGQKNLILGKEVVEEAIRLHRRFSPYSGMPGKPIRFLESILLSHADMKPAVEKKTGRRLSKKAAKATKIQRKPTVKIDKQEMLKAYAEESGMPLFMIDPDQPMDVNSVKKYFYQNVFGQNKAVDTVADTLAAVKTALTRTGKPIASFLFVGPTGVGKTELAKVLAGFMFGSRDKMIRFDMSEFSDPWSVMRLTGQGYYSDGLLTSAVRREPFGVLLFDEIEKADASFYDLLLQILGEGRLTDSRGKLVNFCSTLIIMTSNIGASGFMNNKIGWKKEVNPQDVSDHFIRAVEKNFRPELFNRIDSVVAFEPLSRETMQFVVEREIKLFQKREGIRFRHLELILDDAVPEFLAGKGYDPRYGARYLQRTIREELAVPLAYNLNAFEYDDRLMVKVTVENDSLSIQTTSDPLAFELLMEQWDVLTLAEQTSDLRRKMMLILQGALMMRMQSELDMMEADKKRNEDAFWKNRTRAGLYTHLMQAGEKTESLYLRIKQLEIEIALATMEQGDFQTDFEERLEEWKEAFFQLLKNIYSLLFPDQNTCYLAIYSSDPVPFLKQYLEIIREKGFPVKSAHAVWYREGYAPEAGKDGESGSAPYRKVVIAEDQLYKAELPEPKEGDRLFGMELCLNAEAVGLFFSEETGMQLWENKDKNTSTYGYVRAALKPFRTPVNIHRKQFYQQPRPRRIIGENAVNEIQWGVTSQLKRRDYSAWLLEKLDEQFHYIIEKSFWE